MQIQRENQRVRLTKRLIMEAFTECLKEKEIHKISIRELCAKAGINHCTFYRYYGSQYDVLTAMEDDLLNAVSRSIAADDKTEPLQTLFEYLEKNADICKLLVNNNVDQTFPERLFSMPIIQQQMNYMVSNAHEKINVEYYSNFLFYGVYRIVQLWINKPVRESPREIVGIILTLFGQPRVKKQDNDADKIYFN